MVPRLSKVPMPLHDPHPLHVNIIDASEYDFSIAVAKVTNITAGFRNEQRTCGCLALAAPEWEAGRLGELGTGCPPGVAGSGLNEEELGDSGGL